MTAGAQVSGIGITRVAQGFLSLSSALRPLAPQLSNIAMSAGFASFQFGGLPAAITLATAAIATWRDVLKSWLDVALKANLQFSKFRGSFFQYNVALESFRIQMGLTVQQAFVPFLIELTKLVQTLDTDALAKFIHWSGKVAESFAFMTRVMLNLYNAASKINNHPLMTFLKNFSPPHILARFFAEPVTSIPKDANDFLLRTNDITANFRSISDAGRKFQLDAASSREKDRVLLAAIRDATQKTAENTKKINNAAHLAD
jgi:hypothetical protein